MLNSKSIAIKGLKTVIRFLPLVFCVALLSLICAWVKESAPGNHTEDERKIRELETDAAKAIVTKDLDKLVSLYADDAALYDESNPSIRGKDAIRETWKADFSRPGVVLGVEPRTVEVSSGGDLAWAHGVYKMTTKDAAGKFLTDEWEYALVYKKQTDGEWKIMADSANSLLHFHLLNRPPKRRSPYAPLAPLIGLACLASIIWFLFGMPVVVLISGYRSFRSRRLSASFLVSFVIIIAFFLTAIILWKLLTVQEWNLSLLNAFQAAGDTARYGNPVEDTAEDVLVALLVLSTLSAAASGMISGTARWLWVRRRNLAPRDRSHYLF